MLVRASLIIAIAANACAVAKDFSTKVVDGLGRPVEGVKVHVYWIRSKPGAKTEGVDLGNALTDMRGKAKGSYRKEALPQGEHLWIDISKPGYSGYSTTGLDRQFVIRREFHAKDLDRIGALNPIDLKRELRELFAGRFEGGDLAEKMFVNDAKFRPALRELITDPKVAKQAVWPLAFIGAPEDMRWVVEHAPKIERELFADRWAYAVACSLTEPTTEREWAFLRQCACGDMEDGWVDAGAIQTLKLIASEKSIEVLEEARAKNNDHAAYIDEALAYARTKPSPLADTDLNRLAGRLASIIKIGNWRGNQPAVFNASGDKAYVDMTFVGGRDRLTYTATFHKADDVWRFHGVRETMQALMAKGSSAPDVESQWQTIDEGFKFKIPPDWKKEDVQGIDSHVGKYRGPTAYLEFDEIHGLGLSVAETNLRIAEFRAKEADRTRLEPGEEIWHVNGRIAQFVKERADRKVYGVREYDNVARLSVPYEGEEAYLSIYILFKSDDDLPTVKKILQSIEWRRPASKDVGK